MRLQQIAPRLLLALTAASVQPAAPPGPLELVTKLYQEYAATAVIDSPELNLEDLFGRPRTAMAHYLDDPLIALVLADRACSERKQEVCNLDFMPIWDAQDAVGATVTISQAKDSARVVAEVRYAPSTVRRLTYVLVKTPAGWRIHDIEYDSHASLVKMLKTPVK